MGALSSSLTAQKQNLEHLFDQAGEQLRHAADATNIIEASRAPGRASRWLFGYGGDDE